MTVAAAVRDARHGRFQVGVLGLAVEGAWCLHPVLDAGFLLLVID